MKKDFLVFADGGSRGNPGSAAIGFVVKDKMGRTIYQQGKYIGKTTNNVAEYQAVIEALKWLVNKSKFSVGGVQFFLDSKLVVNQLNGLFKVKEVKMRNSIIKVRQLERELERGVSYQLIPRKENSLADTLVNQTLNKRLL
ncbi:hypothetical protein A2Z41_02545 [Microgenomates group bacterium RBG_19FT_COMBO_39_10]|nr:MAG: hypothetical protein A2Z41_02545 [Microgenomates group bacterium RBG_19FT_COMBO_39_10]